MTDHGLVNTFGTGTGTGTGTDTGSGTSTGTGTEPVEVIRNEERLVVGTESIPVERVRLQKIIVTEEKVFTVTVRREEVRLIREPFSGEHSGDVPADDANTPRIMILHEERVVMTTEVVPVERVWLETHRVSRTETVTAALAHEQVTLTDPPRR